MEQSDEDKQFRATIISAKNLKGYKWQMFGAEMLETGHFILQCQFNQ